MAMPWGHAALTLELQRLVWAEYGRIQASVSGLGSRQRKDAMGYNLQRSDVVYAMRGHQHRALPQGEEGGKGREEEKRGKGRPRFDDDNSLLRFYQRGLVSGHRDPLSWNSGDIRKAAATFFEDLLNLPCSCSST